MQLFIKYRTLKRHSPKFKVSDTFLPSLPVKKILEYRLSVCKDYAKLTAALLLNLYPKNKIYFYTFLMHVATGIEINGKVYILDQKLPIVGEQAWLNRWNKNKATKLELQRNKDKFDVKYLGKIDDAIKRGEKEVTYALKNQARIYDIDDKIIKDSLLRYYTSLLQREYVGNFSKVKGLDITKKDDDLILHISLRW